MLARGFVSELIFYHAKLFTYIYICAKWVCDL